MPPNYKTGVLFENDKEVLMSDVPAEVTEPDKRRLKLVWRNIFLIGHFHVGAVYGLYLLLTLSVTWKTVLFGFVMYQAGVLGITAGAHRYWSHKSFKAKWPLKLMLVIFQTIAFQGTTIDWVKDHRVHHKYSETDADPYNARRGFFFSHMGWLFCRKHPEVLAKGKGIDFSDLYADPFLKFQRDYFYRSVAVVCIILPTVIPIYFWGESLMISYFVNYFRYILTLHSIWLVNSVAHMYGNKPYDVFIDPAENAAVSVLALGEGWHNYHHTFPWDYRAAELGKCLNGTGLFLNLMGKIGWAYDMKTVPEEIIRKRMERTGDRSHNLWESGK